MSFNMKIQSLKNYISDRDLLKIQAQPNWHKPTLATLTKDRLSNNEGIYERRLDKACAMTN